MAEDYRNSKEWQALNRIWKAVPAFARENVKDDFRVITELIKRPAVAQEEKKAVAPAAMPAVSAPSVGATNFLAGLSNDARKLALSLLTKAFRIKKYDVQSVLDYDCKEMRIVADAVVTITLWRVMAYLIKYGVGAVKILIANKKNKKKAVQINESSSS